MVSIFSPDSIASSVVISKTFDSKVALEEASGKSIKESAIFEVTDFLASDSNKALILITSDLSFSI